MKTIHVLLATFLTLLVSISFAQEKEKAVVEPTVDRSYKPLMIKLDDSGKKYIRFITWHQFWASGSEKPNGGMKFTPSLRRSRFLAYAQIEDRFLIITHFGVNSLSSAGLDPLGRSANTQLFLHGAWVEFKVWKNHLNVGGGLHYFNGLSRASNQSTLNFMTLDNYRQAWAQIGLSDQFARTMGIFAKGRVGKLNYHVAISDPIVQSLDTQRGNTPAVNKPVYRGKELNPEKASTIIQGYFDYQLLDQESNKLPYRVGTYLGKKTVFNIGAGFVSHPNGTVHIDENTGDEVFNNVSHFAFDAFYDAPLGKGAINAYAAYYHFDYGNNYSLGTTYGTGSSVYGHVGYLLPKFNENFRIMPYVASSMRDFEAFENSSNTFNLGMNCFLNGHNAKLTLEYNTTMPNYSGGTKPERVNKLTLQTMIFL